ncbi:MAG: hypothetical protein AAFV07_10450, partial [Bacteroidota bacterium]
MRYFVCVILLCTSELFAQIVPPYFNDFEAPGDTAGWTHTALSGSDVWTLAMPNGALLQGAFSGSLAWATDSAGEVPPNSDLVLESPAFDLSQTTTPLMISFQQKRDIAFGMNLWLEYSLDSGQIWQVLNPGITDQVNWQGNSGWTGFSVLDYTYSAHSLQFLQGNADVRFRFRVSTG